jgi:transcriptional regulator with XRE-family HTH domain
MNTSKLPFLLSSVPQNQNDAAVISNGLSPANLKVRRKNFGLWLRDCRKKAALTQADLANALGYDSSQLISNIERGVSLLPSKRLPDFSKVLGCSSLEMEVRYFQCSARSSSESRMPDLLLKYMTLIETLEYGSGKESEAIEALRAVLANDQNESGLKSV